MDPLPAGRADDEPADDTEPGPGEGDPPSETCVLCEDWMTTNTTGDILGEPAYKLGGPVGVGGTTEDAVAEVDAAIDALIAPLDLNQAVPLDCLAYRFDIVLRGRRSTFFENRPEGN